MRVIVESVKAVAFTIAVETHVLAHVFRDSASTTRTLQDNPQLLNFGHVNMNLCLPVKPPLYWDTSQ
jgi:hypothetical protein